MRRRLRRKHAFDASLAEAVLVLGKALGKVVAHEGGGNRAAGRDTEPASDDRGAQQRHPVARQVLPHAEHHAQADAGGVAAQGEPLFHGEQNLADAEESDHRDQKVDAAQKLVPAEGHAQCAGDRVHADPGEQEAERHRNDGLVLVLAPEPHERAERQEIDGEEFRRSKSQRERRDAGRKKRDQQHGRERADER